MLKKRETAKSTRITTSAGATHSLRVETRTEFDERGATAETVTDWYFTSADGKKTARVMRLWRAHGQFCVWTFQFRPHPTRPRDNENRHGLQIDNWISGAAGSDEHKHPSVPVESALWTQAHKTAIEWVTKRRILRGGLTGWHECGWREGMAMHPSTVARDAR